ncbi:ComEC/Rec2 family competence protein, partial [Thermodesulfobacteriota bacterium]
MNLRPLIPALSAFITGILLNYILYACIPLVMPVLFIIIVVLLIASVLKIFSTKTYIILFIFLITGIQLSFRSYGYSNLLPIADVQVKPLIEGTVLNPSSSCEWMFNNKNTKVEIIVERLFINNQKKMINEKLLVTIYNNERMFSPGDKIRIPAKLRPIQNFNNPGRYNYKLAMRLRGFYCT